MNNEDKQLLENIIPIATKNMKQLLEKNKDKVFSKTQEIQLLENIIPMATKNMKQLLEKNKETNAIPDIETNAIPDIETDAISNDNPNKVVIIEKDYNNGNFSGKEKSTKITIKNGQIIADSD